VREIGIVHNGRMWIIIPLAVTTMHSSGIGMRATSTRDADYSRVCSSLTLAAIGLVACVCADMTHEVLGHMTAAWLAHVRIVSLSTVAIQTLGQSRFVAAAGTAANLILGAASLLLLSRWDGHKGRAYFLWLLAGFNLLNSGYLVASAILGNGDWAAVISGLSPAWLWRCALGLAGAILYALSILWLAHGMRRLATQQVVTLSELQRLVWLSFLAGGLVLTIAALFNPISPHLILLSGVGASFGLNWGLLLIPGMVRAHIQGNTVPISASAPPSLPWLGFALVLGGLFVAVFGPGIRF
jgi:hypothetical protein